MKTWWCFLYALLLIGVDSYADNCNILLNGSNVTETRLLVGDSVILECNCETHWEQDGEYIINDSRHYITNGNTLTILGVRSSDTGNYSCGDSNITIIVNDTYVESVFIPNSLLLCVNQSVLLECQVTLNTIIGSDLSVLNISWFHNETYIPTNNITRNDKEFLYISTLELLSVNDTNSGVYTCEANVIESESTIANYTFVYVQAKPALNIFTEQLLLYPGGDAIINCSSSAGSYTIVGPNLFSSNQPVTITSFSYENEGDYNCSSSNMCGENFDVLTMQMLAPSVTISGHYTRLRVGSSASIECETVPSIPGSVIEWQGVLPSFNSYSYNGELAIDPVMLTDDNKTFTCVVWSHLISNNLTESIVLTVINTSVSSVSVKFDSSYAIGEQALIQCNINLTNAIGPNTSSLNIKWFKSGQIIRDYYTMHKVALPSSVFHSSLVLSSLSFNDAGVYNCTASLTGSRIKPITDSMALCLDVLYNDNPDSLTNLALGYSAAVECVNLSSLAEIAIKWRDKTGNIITNSNTLVLPNVLPSLNDTLYICTAEVNTNPESCPHSQNKTVKVTVKETYIERVDFVSQESYLINSLVTIDCIITLNTPVGPGIQPSVTWYHHMIDSEQYSSLMRNNDTVFNSTLKIPSIQVSGAGVYHCNAGIDSNVTTNNISICVTVNETLPSVTEDLSLGQYYSIDCITGPVPTGVSVSWLFTNGSIYSNSNTLMIPSILPSHINTQYNCTIMIGTNPTNCSTQSQVITFRVKRTYINSVTLVTAPIVSFINSSVLLTCTINLNTGIGPDTSFISHYWYYNNNTDISNRSTQLMISGDSKSLVTTLNITSVQPFDTGEYQCGASIDGNDTDIQSMTNLCVEVPHSVITINDSYTNPTIGEIREYDCASGYRQSGVTIQWETPAGMLLSNPLKLTVNQSINYTCIIRVEANDCPNSLTKNVNFKIRDTFVKEVTTSSTLLILSDTFQQLKCNSTTNTNINISSIDISSIVQIFWYKYNGKSIESIKISNSSTGVSILPTVSVNNTLFQSSIIFSSITSSTPMLTLGNYTCVAWIGEQSDRNETSNNVQVLMKINNSRDSVSFNQLNSHYTAGDDLAINCTITPYEMSPSLQTFATIKLIHNKVPVVESIITSNEYTNITISKDFNGVKLSDAGTYTCQYYLKYANFTFVLPSEIKTDETNLFVMIPSNNSPVVSLIPDEQYYDIGSNVTLTCSVNYPPDSHVDISTVLNINLFIGNNSVIRQNFTNNITYELNNLQLHDATSYTCTYYISDDNDSSFILKSESTNHSIDLVVRRIEVEINSSHLTLLDYPSYNNASIICSLKYEPPDQFNENELQNWFYQTSNTDVTLSLDDQVRNIFEKEVSYTTPGISQYECGITLLIKGKESNYSNSINITVKGPGLPNKPINMSSAVLNTTAVKIEWVVTSVTYTPETYTVHYQSLSCYHNGSASINGSTSLEVFTKLSNTQYSITIIGLMPGINYTYYIVSMNTEGHANTTNERFTLLETTPDGGPFEFKTHNVTAYEMTFTWLPPLECFRNGDIIKYFLNCSFNNATHPNIQQSVYNQITSKRNNRYTVHHLYPFTNYTCHLSAANSIGEGPSASLNVTTLEASPESEPVNLRIISTTSSSLVLTWSEPIQPNGVIVKYTVNCSSDIFENETIDNIAVLDGLKPFTNYTCSVSAHTKIGVGPAATITGQTDESTPEAISNTSITFNDTLILFYWMKPIVTNGKIIYYQINLTASSTIVKTLKSNGSNYITIESDPFVPYQLSIAGYTNKGRGELWISNVFFSKEGIPPKGPENVTAMWTNGTTVKVTWLPLALAEARGFITHYSVYTGYTRIINVSNDSSFAYIDNLNPMLQYSISVSASTKVGESSNNSVVLLPAYVVETSNNWLPYIVIGAGCIIAICIVCCTITVCCCCRRKRSRRKNPTKTEEAVELYTYIANIATDTVDNDYLYITAPLNCRKEAAIEGTGAQRIDINEFPSFVSRSKRAIEYEFEEIERISPIKATSIASKHDAFNRLENICPFDDNIVPLSTSEKDEESIYINASYIDGYQRKNAYIATQGPLKNTIGHFWQMIIEYKLQTIVMLTKVFEGDINKCAQYWPENVNETQKLDNGIVLRTKSEEVHCWYTKRQLLVTKDDDESIAMTIRHYQLTVWPDHGVPVDKIVMISFIDNIRLSHPPKGPPLVVHCSAGVGRTGTFIVMDTMLQRMKQEDTLNIYDFLLQIRHQRIKLVQTKEQYIYIHKSLADHIQCGETSFSIEKAPYRIKELKKKNEDEECEFQKEFELLKELSDNTRTISCSIGMDNQERNRFDYNLPYNHTRVKLSDTGNDYINASWVEGYKTGTWFIVTQIPLKSTQTNFWTMIHEQNCNVIVLLHPVGTDERPQFWPAKIGQTRKYQDLTVEHSLEKEENDYQVITLELKFKNDSAHNVTLYYYDKWNINTNNKPYVKPLFGILARNQLENGNRPIAVVCNDGVGCSGTFLTAYSQIERAKTEGVSDIFQFIRKARSQRPGLVDCLERYIYCHELLSEYAQGMLQHEDTSYI